MKLKFYIFAICSVSLLLPVLVTGQGLIIPAGGNVIANNGNIILYNNFINSGTFTHNGGTFIFAGTTQTLSGATATYTFNNVTIAAYATVTSSTGINSFVVNGILNTGVGSTLNLGTATVLNGTLGTISNNGTIRTSVITTASATPIPTGKTWGGTIEYAASTGAQTVLNGTYNNLKLSNTSGTNSVSGSITVSDTLTFTGGTITTGSNTIYLNATGTVTRTSGHVIGNFKKYIATGATSETFEIGDAGNYTPVALAFASVTTAGDITASVVSGDHPNIGTSTINAVQSVNRNWTLTNSGTVFTNYNATFTFVAGDIDSGASTGAFGIGNYNGGSWTYPTVGAATATSTQATGLGVFGDFQIGTMKVLPPNLGTAASFVLFTVSGAVGNTGVSQITGNIGTNLGAITGFGTSTITGTQYTANGVTAQCSTDLMAAYTQLNNTAPTSTTHTAVFGGGETLFAGVYSIGAAGSVAGSLTLDAQGNPNALFIFKIGGAFTTGASTTVNLVNNASACNVFWVAEGAIAMAASTTMRGTLIAHNAAISMAAGGILEGRMFSTTGAVAVDGVNASIPICYSVASSWTGAISTDWYTTGNWSTNIIPTTTTNITIATSLTNYPVLNSGTGSVQNILIQNGASLIVTGATLQTAGSISNSGTFTASNGTIEMDGPSAQTIPALVFSANAVKSLTINNAAGVILGGNITVSDTLTFTGGTITTGSNTIYLNATGTVTRTSGHVIGNFKKYIATGATSETFEIGDAGNYTPVALAFASVTTAGDITASVVPGDHPNIGTSTINAAQSVNRNWTLTNSGTVFTNYNATFTFVAGDIDAGASTGFFGIGNYNGGSWAYPTVGTATATSTQATGLGAFGDFQIGTMNALPPNLGTAASFVLFTVSGAVGNTGVSQITGNIGTNLGAITGFGTSTITGTQYTANGVTAQCSTDLMAAYTQLNNTAPTSTTHAAVFGGGETLFAGVYSIGAAASVAGSLTLDAQGNPNALFIFKIGGAFTTGASTTINLVNNASACNVFWVAEGAIAMAASTTMRGTLIAHNAAISMAAGGILEGRMFSTTGAVAVDGVNASIPVCYSSWTGATSTDWFTTGNWSDNLIPTTTTNIKIPGSLTNYPVLNSGIGSAQNILIQNGASLIVTGAKLQTAGSISNSGTFTASNGTIEMNGPSAQTIPALVFSANAIKNLTINDTAGVTLGGTLNLSGILLVSNGQFNTGGYLTLLSTATQTALIDGSGTGEVLGTVTMQRYLSSGFGYKYFSSPFQAATVSQFSNDINLADTFPTFYSYDESLVSSGWVIDTASANPLTPLQGYAANLGTSSSAKTVDIAGVVSNHTVSLPTLYNHNNPYTLGFNLVGNPYPSPIDWDASTGVSRTNIDNAVYYFDAGITDRYTGTYSTYIGGVSSDGIANNIIPAMQGFFIHVSDGTFPVTGSLILNNSARVNNASPVFHWGPGGEGNQPLLRLNAGFVMARIPSDPVVIYFEDKATPAFDKEFDAFKLMNTSVQVPSLYALTPDKAKLSISAIPVPDSTTIIPLGLKTDQQGLITFNAVNIMRMPAGLNIYLYDAQTKIFHNLQQEPLYQVTLDAGKYETRFSIVFSHKELLVDTLPVVNTVNLFDAYSSGKKLFVTTDIPVGQKGDMVMYNMLGQAVWKQEISGTGKYQFQPPCITGVYVLTFYMSERIFSKKLFIGN